MKKNKIIKNKYKDLSEEEKQKRRDYQKQYYKKYYIEKKLTIKEYN